MYGEKAVLETESLELQRRLAQLKAEREKAFVAVEEVCDFWYRITYEFVFFVSLW